jgi:ribosomal protein L12E/L44/L45/RPP1/RPP2
MPQNPVPSAERKHEKKEKKEEEAEEEKEEEEEEYRNKNELVVNRKLT